jgi:hypothetical protein
MTSRHFLFGILAMLLSHVASAQVNPNNRSTNAIAINASWIFQPNTVIPAINRFPVRVGGRWGYCDSLGKIAIAPAYDAAADFENGIGVVQQGNKAYAVDSSGRIITPEGFDMLRVIYGNMLAYYEFFGEQGNAGGWGLITTSGKKILPAKYSDITGFFGGVIGYKADSLWGYINPDGLVITEPIYDTALVMRNRTLMLVKGKKLGAITFSGTRLVGDTCDYLKWMHSDILGIRIKNLWGAIYCDGNKIMPCIWDTLLQPSHYYIVGARGDSAVLYSSKYQKRLSVEKYIGFLPANGKYMKGYTKKKLCGLFDTLGQLVLQPIYTDILDGNEGMWLLYQQKKWGAASADGKIILPTNYELVRPFAHGVALVYIKNLSLLVNKKGEHIVKLAEQDILFRENLVKARRKDGGASFLKIDLDGNVLERTDYAQLRTIKIGGDSRLPVDLYSDEGWANQPLSLNSVAGVRLATTDWFFIYGKGWGLRSITTRDTIIQPMFDFIRRVNTTTFFGGQFVPCFYTVVGKKETKNGPIINGKQTFSKMLYGVVNDTSGALVLPLNYTHIEDVDLNLCATNRAYKLIRCTRADGQAGLVSIDGTAGFIPLTYAFKPTSEGMIKVCIEGKLLASAEAQDGTFLMSMAAFIYSNEIDEKHSFSGPAGVSKEELKRMNVFLAGGKWGYISMTGKVMIPTIYSAVSAYRKGLCIVSVEKKWGLVDTLGKMRIAPEYWHLRFSKTNDTLVVAEKYMPRYGYIDTLGKLVIPPGLKNAKLMGGGYIAFNNTGKWGVCKTSGGVLVEEQFTDIHAFAEGLAAVRVGAKWGFIDTSGTLVIAATHDAVGDFHCGFARVRMKNKWGFIDKNGALMVEPKYDMAKDFSGSFAPVKLKSLWVLVDGAGREQGKLRYREINPVAGSTLWAVRGEGQFALANNAGKELTRQLYDVIQACSQGRVMVRKNLYWSFIDTLGVSKVGFVFARVTHFENGLMAVCWEQGWGFVDREGRRLNTPYYKITKPFSEGLGMALTQNYKTVYVDTTGKEVIGLERDVHANSFSGNIALVNATTSHPFDTWYVTRAGHQLGRLYFDDGYAFSRGVAPVKAAQKWGVISFTGRYLVPPYFDGIEPYSEGLARCRLFGMTGIFTSSGKTFVPVEYDYITDVSPRIQRVHQGNGVGYMRPDGSWMWPVQE